MSLPVIPRRCVYNAPAVVEYTCYVRIHMTLFFITLLKFTAAFFNFMTCFDHYNLRAVLHVWHPHLVIVSLTYAYNTERLTSLITRQSHKFKHINLINIAFRQKHRRLMTFVWSLISISEWRLWVVAMHTNLENCAVFKHTPMSWW